MYCKMLCVVAVVVLASGAVMADALYDDFLAKDLTYTWDGNFVHVVPTDAYVGSGFGYPGFDSKVSNGYAWVRGTETFRITQWGNNAYVGLNSATGAGHALYFRTDLIGGKVAAYAHNGFTVDTGLSWGSGQAFVGQIEYDLEVGTATFRARPDASSTWTYEQTTTFAGSTGNSLKTSSNSYSNSAWTMVDWIDHTGYYLSDEFSGSSLDAKWEVSGSGVPSVWADTLAISRNVVRSDQELGYSWGSGLATFEVDSWGNNMLMGLADKEASGAPELYFRNDQGTGTIVAYGKSAGGQFMDIARGGDTGIPWNATDFVGTIEFDRELGTVTYKAKYGSQTNWSYVKTADFSALTSGWNSQIYLNSYGGTPTVFESINIVPEPCTLLVFSVGALLGMRRKLRV